MLTASFCPGRLTDGGVMSHISLPVGFLHFLKASRKTEVAEVFLIPPRGHKCSWMAAFPEGGQHFRQITCWDWAVCWLGAGLILLGFSQLQGKPICLYVQMRVLPLCDP